MSLSLIYNRVDHFRDFHVWPRQQELNVERWLENFHVDESELAKRLLSSFTYFNKAMTAALLRSSIQNWLSLAWNDPRFPKPPSLINFSDVRFVKVEGEEPHPTDSGNLFSRKLRDEIRIPELRISTPSEALTELSSVRHFVFVDDFVGSGNQFRETIERVHCVGDVNISFSEILDDQKHTVSYCPCVATEYAKNTTLGPAFPKIILFPAHLLDNRHNVTVPNSRVWRGLTQSEASAAISQLKQISARAGYSAEDLGQNDWRGFHGLGLTIAFEHGIPDASLPIFFSERNGWKPLMRRHNA